MERSAEQPSLSIGNKTEGRKKTPTKRIAGRSTKSQVLSIRLDDSELRSAELVAQVTCRSLTGLIRYALMQYVAAQYPEAMKPGARVVARIEEGPLDGQGGATSALMQRHGLAS